MCLLHKHNLNTCLVARPLAPAPRLPRTLLLEGLTLSWRQDGTQGVGSLSPGLGAGETVPSSLKGVACGAVEHPSPRAVRDCWFFPPTVGGPSLYWVGVTVLRHTQVSWW